MIMCGELSQISGVDTGVVCVLMSLIQVSCVASESAIHLHVHNPRHLLVVGRVIMAAACI